MNNVKLNKYLMLGMLSVSIFLVTSCNSNLTNSNKNKNTLTESINTVDSVITNDTSIPENTEKSTDDYIITDISSWEHPVKDVFNKYNIKINKIELLRNRQYPIFYVEFNPIYSLDSQNAKYYDVLLKKIASANGYWSFKVIDDKNTFVFNVECDKQKKSVTEIVVNGKKGLLKEMLDNNRQTEMNADKAFDYLLNEVPEINEFEEQLSKESNNEVTLIMRLDGVPNNAADNQYKDYYCIYVGENHLDYTIRWHTFYVAKALDRILVDDITGELITLEQWREKRPLSAETAIKSNEEARKIIADLVEKKVIMPQEPNCQIQNWEIRKRDFITYYIIRIAYIDPNDTGITETMGRYWVSAATGDVLQEDLWTGNLTKINTEIP